MEQYYPGRSKRKHFELADAASARMTSDTDYADGYADGYEEDPTPYDGYALPKRARTDEQGFFVSTS